MLVLAIETCLGPLSVALARADGTVSAHAEEPAGSAHAELLVPVVRDVLREAGCSFREVSRIAVTLGPGSFTGVRTGIAAARAFALGTDIEVVGVGSLALLATMALCAGKGGDLPVLAVMDARRGRVYAQLFGAHPFLPLSEPAELSPEEAYSLATSHGVSLIAGSGVDLVTRGHEADVLLQFAPSSEKSAAVALAGLAPSLAPLQDISPIYIRPPDAKVPAGPLIMRVS